MKSFISVVHKDHNVLFVKVLAGENVECSLWNICKIFPMCLEPKNSRNLLWRACSFLVVHKYNEKVIIYL